jgi:dihydrofolate synthase / folylpolyglutamate synthase
MTVPWTPEEAERYLLGLELFGMRFGLDRMRRLMTALGSPEQRFRSIHVVGTNGKSSTTRMIASIIGAHARRPDGSYRAAGASGSGVATGAYLSPHLVGFEERVRVGEEDVTPAAFAAAVQRAAHAAELVDRTAAAGDRVTQFEALTAAAYSELAERHVEVAVIEAGLGGRYDATNVIPSGVQVLTNVGLEHTRWLGPTVRDIAGEKLDVVRPGATLVVGADLHPDALEVAERVVAERGARLVRAPGASAEGDGIPGRYQRRNFALARAAAEAELGALDPTAVRAAATATRVPGRLHVVDHDPLTLLDGAHNPAGVEALAEALLELVRPGRSVAAAVSILDDKDAAGMLRVLLAACDEVVLCRSANPRALPPATLASLAEQVTGRSGEVVSEPRRALARARELAGPDGVAVATGSIYLVADLLRPPGRRAASML